MSETVDRELNWDDTIEKDGGEYILLPEGDYSFTVETFERGRHTGSDKLPACNKAILTLKVSSAEGEVSLTHNLFLHTKTEGLLSAFFSCIGQKKKGEKLVMNWNRVIGATGRCKIGIHEYTGKDREQKKSNQIMKFYPMEDSKPNFTPGAF